MSGVMTRVILRHVLIMEHSFSLKLRWIKRYLGQFKQF